MVISEIKLYELLKAKIGEREAEAFVEILDRKVDSRFEERKSEFILEKDKDKLLTKSDAITIFATKEDLALGLSNVRNELLRTIYLVGIVQLVGIIGSVVAIVRFMK